MIASYWVPFSFRLLQIEGRMEMGIHSHMYSCEQCVQCARGLMACLDNLLLAKCYVYLCERGANTNYAIHNRDSMLLFLVEDWRDGRPQGIDGLVLVDSGVFGHCSFSER